MSKEYVIQIPSHNSIYGEKIKETYYGRQVTCYYNLPEKGVNKDTGVLVLLEGFGVQANDQEHRNMRSHFADSYNLVTIQCDYFGFEFMEDGKKLKKNISRNDLKDFFTEEEIDEIYQEEQLNLKTFFRIGSRKTGPIKVIIQEDLSDETLENFNDMGIMQALDHLICASEVMKRLQEQDKRLNRKKVIFYGHAHGAYLSYICNALAPQFISLIIDYSAELEPVYLKHNRILTYMQGNFVCYIVFSYLIRKIYDSQLVQLPFLYEKFQNNCQILSYEMETNKKEKISFCRKIQNCHYQQLTNPEEADFIKLFDKIMQERPVKIERGILEESQTVKWETPKATYTIDYLQGLPYVAIKENKMGLEIHDLRKTLFSGNINKFHQNLLDCLDRLNDLCKEIAEEKIDFFQEAMQNISFAMQDHDYLLVTDLLKFEILPCLNKKEEDRDRIFETINKIAT